MSDARTHLVFLIPLIPGISAAILGLSWMFGVRMHKTTVKIVSCGSVFISFLVSAACVDALFKFPERFYKQELWTWFSTWGTNATEVINVSFAFDVDPLSAIMILVVTGIGLLIHIYSTAYMGEDEGFQKFMAYLNLFMFSMLILVLGSNFLTMFIGWEGVGLCSYLLIGFWYKDLANAKAAKKAFVVNRVGDFLFITGLFALFWVVGQTTGFYSIEFSEMRRPENLPHYLFTQHNASILGIPLITFATLMFFGGATGKSAQIPLFVWLPDAMAGPTPVSALIHAATMVTSGLYMITRLNFLFTIAETTLLVIAVIGVLTALMAASIGLFQYDIKKVLAYSTVSQLGYMFLAMGTGAYAAGMFHVFTHAFFKALMFLGSGSVIHSLHHALPHGVDAQDMRNMGGLRKYMPVTFWTFMVGWLAICGIFPFAGFWSKDEILWKTVEHGMNGQPYWYVIYLLGLATAGLTAFYMTRQVAMVFFGEYRGRKIGEDYLQKHEGHHATEHAAPAAHGSAHDDHADDHGHGGGAHDDDHHDDHGHVSDPHESPFAITLPLRTLAIGSAIVGFFGVGAWFTHLTSIPNYWNEWLEPVIFTQDELRAINNKAFGLNEDGTRLTLLAQHGDDHATPAHATDAAHGAHGTAAPREMAAAPAHGDSHAAPAGHGDSHAKPVGDGHGKPAHGDSHAATGGHGEAHGGAHHAPWYVELLFAVISVVVALGSMRFAWQLYVKQPERPAAMLAAYHPGGAKARTAPGFFYSLIYDKYRWDELYEMTVIAGTRKLSKISALFDTYIVDGIVNGLGYALLIIRTIAGILDTYVVDSFAVLGSARVVGWVGDRFRGIQSGDLQGYLRWVGYGALAIIGFYVLVFSKEII